MSYLNYYNQREADQVADEIRELLKGRDFIHPINKVAGLQAAITGEFGHAVGTGRMTADEAMEWLTKNATVSANTLQKEFEDMGHDSRQSN